MTVSESVETKLKSLEGLQQDHINVAGYMLSADQGAAFPVDIVAQAVLHRSMGLVRGFCDAVRSENYLCAAPLVRLQLDNLLRFYALFIVHDPHETAFRISAGTPLTKQVDRDGRRMTDQHLVRKLSTELPWVSNVYRETSGFVHLSEKHVHNTRGSVDGANRQIEFCVSGRDYFLPDEFRIEAIECMIEITNQVLRYVYGWAKTKDTVGASRHKEGNGQQRHGASQSEPSTLRANSSQ